MTACTLVSEGHRAVQASGVVRADDELGGRTFAYTNRTDLSIGMIARILGGEVDRVFAIGIRTGAHIVGMCNGCRWRVVQQGIDPITEVDQVGRAGRVEKGLRADIEGQRATRANGRVRVCGNTTTRVGTEKDLELLGVRTPPGDGEGVCDRV